METPTTPGTTFPDRRALSDAGIHRDVRRRIDAGAESVVLNALYVDDEDYGTDVLFTGEGGRDQETGRQVRPQTLTRRNQLLALRVDTGDSVRVVRSSDVRSRYAPANGYRYDGRYRVTRYWKDVGLDGFQICRYRLEAVPGESFAFERVADPEVEYGMDAPKRVDLSLSRVVRDTRVGRRVKELHDYRCQICGTLVETPKGLYAESCHIRPLGAPHHGPDCLENVLCLCPTCHVRFDYHAIHIGDEYQVVETGQPIRLCKGHLPHLDHLHYHRRLSGRVDKNSPNRKQLNS